MKPTLSDSRLTVSFSQSDDPVSQFEDAWRQGTRPRLEDFVALAGGRPAVVLDLICCDMEQRHALQEQPRVEDYLRRIPELSTLEGALAGLVEWEYLLRQRDGETVTAEEYTARFPNQREALVGLLSRLRAGRFRIEGKLGSGGMGVVYQARDEPCDRSLAVKVLRRDVRDNPAAQARFLTEARLTARLQHPGVPPVHEIGRLDDGRPFFAMKLIRGRTLADLLHERPAPTEGLPRWLALFGQVCQTMAYAHSQGVIHRDLKPSNIMVGAFGEVQVMDWGLAKVLSTPSSPTEEAAVASSSPATDAGLTRTGELMGTPAFAPPEQARGEWTRVDARADVFSLGGILCQILTGEPPYRGDRLVEVIEKSTGADLTDARKRLKRCGADSELIDLAQQCLSADPEDRPANAGVLAEAVARYEVGVRDRLRQAELDSAAAQARAKAERRARLLTVGLAAAGLLLVGGLGVGITWWYQQQQTHSQRQQERNTEIRDVLAEAKKHYRLRQWPEAQRDASRAVGLAQAPEVDETIRAEVQSLARQFDLVSQLEVARIQRCGMHNCAFNYDKDHPAKVFAAFGIDVFQLPVEEAARRVGAFDLVREELVAALDDWAWVLQALDNANPRGEDRGRLLDLADRCDDSPLRADIRRAVRLDPKTERDALARHRETLERRTADPHFLEEPPTTIVLLTSALVEAGGVVRAIELLEMAARKHPDDFWINLKLAEHLTRDRQDRKKIERSLPYWRAALAIRPDNCVVQLNIGISLGNLDKPDQAIEEMKCALDLPYADRARICHSIGLTCTDKNDNKEAEKWYHAAIKHDPTFAPSHINLGALSAASGNLPEAIVWSLKAAELASTDGLSRFNLAMFLVSSKQADEALRWWNEAVKRQPARPEVRNHFAVSLYQIGRKKEAIRILEPILEQPSPRPELAGFFRNLGLMSLEQGELDRALTAFRKGLELKAGDGPLQLGLGQVRLRQGHYTEAFEALTAAQKQLPVGNRMRQQADALLKECEARRQLEGKLAAVRAGQEKPASAQEGLLLATMSFDKGCYVSAARLAEQAFAAEPQRAANLQTGERYNAACAVGLVLAGKGEERVEDEAERARLRGLALIWLRADLTAWSTVVEKQPQAKQQIRVILDHWKDDTDLTSLRGPALEALPETERPGWHKLWEDLDVLLGKLGS
jgi:serine/threonine-protein kinase